MKWFLSALVALSLAFGVSCLNKGENKQAANKMEIATCYGNTPCNACTSCNYCQWCKAGGTCGICASQKKSKSNTYKNPLKTSGRCQAITKKGSQCSRSARSGGYCWQHGG